MNEKTETLRVLLPVKPKDDVESIRHLLRALVPPTAAQARRLYVHRPVESDFFIPETYARFSEVAQLEFEAENATRVETENEMRPLAAEGFAVSAEVVRGTPTEEILREASFWRADLVAVRTRSARAHDSRIGGMASALLHHATCPVLTYREVPAAYRIGRILIPTDFSQASRESADWGLALAEMTGAEPVLLHVIARWNNRHGIDQEELLAMASEELERWKAAAPRIAGRPVFATRAIVADNPAGGIMAFAREHSCDLVVLSATGVSAVRAILLGSNTRKVVRRSPCPVFVIPTSNRVRVEDFLEKFRSGLARSIAPALRAAGRTS
jgi:nucleotide-binding universal stress UspA family protein